MIYFLTRSSKGRWTDQYSLRSSPSGNPLWSLRALSFHLAFPIRLKRGEATRVEMSLKEVR